MPFKKKDEQSQDTNQREEDYKKFFPKIGRDFVSKEDFESFIEALGRFIPGLSVELSNTKAVSLATEYKQQLDGETKSKEYKDLIDIDDKPDEEKQEDSEESEKGLLD